jgi:iron complex outermembrane receptor protein
MTFQPHPLAAAAALVIAGAMTPAVVRAQAAPAPAPAASAAAPAAATPAKDEVQRVEVTGLRASLEASLSRKRNAESVVEVVTADDIGKLPDKNVADAIQRVPGVNIASSAGGEGGFDENDRVSIRGTSPSLTQTLINGHAVATGDWFILDQQGVVGRSVSYSLLPSEIVRTVTVAKSATADLPEGGVAGAVDIETRQPLDFKKPLTVEASVQGVYADLARRTDPQLNALAGWKNDAGTFGVLVQAFSETRHERRDGLETFGYAPIDPSSPAAQAHPDLAGVIAPDGVNSALFEQTRKRVGGLLDIEAKPVDCLTVDLNGFYSKLDASNYNRSFYAAPANLLGFAVPDSYKVVDNTLVSANFSPAAVAAGMAAGGPGNIGAEVPAEVDSLYRPHEGAQTWYLDLNGKYRASDNLTLKGDAGYTRGVGRTPNEYDYFAGIGGDGTVGMNYALHGMGPADLSFPGTDVSNFNTSAFTEGGAYDKVYTYDSERYASLDAELAVDAGVLESMKFGGRYTQHSRSTVWPINDSCQPPSGFQPGPCDNTAAAPRPTWSGGTYPGNFGNGFGAGAGFLRHVWQLDPGAIEAFDKQYANSGGFASTENWQSEFAVKERDAAVYGMANLAGTHWSGNVGLRIVRTNQSSLSNVSDNSGDTVLTPADNSHGLFTPTQIKHDFTDFLPSANFKFDLTRDLVARVAAARTMARADYSALAGAVSLDDTTHAGNGGNPNLKPVRSNNYDATLEWYFAPKSLLSAGVFLMDITSYVDYGTSQSVYLDQTHHQLATYTITAPVNIRAKNKGFELGYQQALPWNLGVIANYTYTDGKTSSGAEMVGNSKNTYNLEAYYDDDTFSTRIAYTYRSAFLAGLNSSFAQHEDGVGDLALSAEYKVNKHVTLTFDALNLNNPTLKYYGENRGQLEALYTSGRQFYLGARFSL